MRDYDCLGILVQPPLAVRGIGQFATPEEIAKNFAGNSLFTIRDSGLYEINADLTVLRKVPLSEMYPS